LFAPDGWCWHEEAVKLAMLDALVPQCCDARVIFSVLIRDMLAFVWSILVAQA